MAVAVPSRRNRRPTLPLRILTAVPLCDGHDSAIMTINHELVRNGAEVVYLGYHQSASAIARAAVQEDVGAIGISSYNGGHIAFFRELMTQLRARGARDIAVFGGGGGTITPADERVLRRAGVDRVFFAGTPLADIVRTIARSGRTTKTGTSVRGDRALARAITFAERRKLARRAGNKNSAFVLGVAGPGGAGKSTLIDELTSRFLQDRRAGRIAVLANDPSHPGSGGALLGDRVSAIYAQHERVFFRSLATRGSQTGISASVPAAIDILRRSGEFDLIVVESVGIGQESDPFRILGRGPRLVDAMVFVTSPHYGGRIQLEKIALLHSADLLVLNKVDEPRATAARAEITAALARREQRPQLHLTIAAQHQHRGIDLLFAAILDLAGLGAEGGERACQLRIHG